MDIRIFAGKTLLVIFLALVNIVSICACLGIASCQYKLAVNLDNKGKYADALKWYKRAADQEYLDALTAMVRCYFDEEKHYYPDNVKRDENLLNTEEYAEKAIEKGKRIHPYYMFSFGKIFLSGAGKNKDYSEAVKWFEKAENNCIPARFILAYCYYNGIGVKENCAEAIRLFRSTVSSVQKTSTAPVQTSSNSQNIEGKMGNYTKQAKAIAGCIVGRLEKNISVQFDSNNVFLGVLPDWKDFVNEKLDDPLREAIKIGNHFENKKDYKEALDWYKNVRKSRGDAESYYCIARIYYHYKPQGKSRFNDGLEQFKKAHDKNSSTLQKYRKDVEYQVYMGYLLYQEEKYGDAIKYFEQAKEMGDKRAQDFYLLCRKKLPDDYKLE